MVEVSVTIAVPEDAIEMAVRLNAAQADLILSLGDKTVEECVFRSFDGSARSWSGRVNGDLVAMWGVYPLEPGMNTGYPWLYSTSRLGETPKLTVEMARRVISDMHQLFPRLFGYVDASHPENVRFAEHLGFYVGGHHAIPPLVTIERTSI